MTNPTKTTQHASARQYLDLIVRVTGAFVILAGILLLSAGRWDWLQGWAFSIVFSFFVLTTLWWSLRNDPELVVERNHTAANVKTWDKVILWVYTVLLVAMLVAAGLDAGRFRWAPAGAGWQAAGWVGALAAGLWIRWVTQVNTFLSRHVRIQEERGQTVVSDGPYGFMRHPMYAGIILLMLSVPLALGSFWALLPGALIGVVYVIRTALEDRTLQAELAGYAEYTRKVRYRLLPGVW